MTAQKEERKATLGRQTERTIFGCALFALLITLIFGGAVLLISAFVISRSPALGAHIGSIGAAMGAVFALVGGMIAGKRHKHTGALAGLLFGALYLSVMLLLSRVAGGSASPLSRLIGYPVLLLLALLGGALGNLRVGGRHRRKRRR